MGLVVNFQARQVNLKKRLDEPLQELPIIFHLRTLRLILKSSGSKDDCAMDY